MLTNHDRDEAANVLRTAYTSRSPIAPLSESYPTLDIDDAYAIQLAQVDHWLASGKSITGYKVGLTAAAMQAQLGVDQPDYGHLLDDMFYLDSENIPSDRFLSPRIEPEISFVLGRPLSGPGITVAKAIQAVDFAIASLEIIDSRIADWKITIADTIADNASSGAAVLGTQPKLLTQIDVNRTGVVLHKNGQVAGSGAGAAALGSPINALTWLANRLGELGVDIPAGSVVMPGSVSAAIPVTAGDTVSAEFAGLGTVSAHFEQKGN